MGDWVLCVGRSLQDRGLLSEVRAGQQKGAIRRGPVEGGLACRQAGTLLVLCPGFEHLMCPLVSRYEATKNPQKSRTVREELGEATCQTMSSFNEGWSDGGAMYTGTDGGRYMHGIAPAVPAWFSPCHASLAHVLPAQCCAEYRRAANLAANNGKERKDLYTDNWDGSE